MKKVEEKLILEHVKLAEGVYSLIYEEEHTESYYPGQFVNLYFDDKSLLLPRPISICDVIEGDNAEAGEHGAAGGKGCVRLVYRVVGKGTELLSTYRPGSRIRVSSPLGNGNFIYGTEAGGKIRSYKDQKVVLIGGGIGVPPMIYLARELSRLGAYVVGALGYQDEVFLFEDMKKHCQEVYVSTDSGRAGFAGNVVEMLREQKLEGVEFFGCGPKVMLRGLSEYAESVGAPCQVSLEERMGCGYGACVGCVCKIKVPSPDGSGSQKIVQKKVCKDGPVFFGQEVVWDE